MKFGICAQFRNVTALEHIAFDYLEVGVQPFLQPERSQEEFEVLLSEARSLPLPIEAANGLLPAEIKLVATPTQQIDRARIERYIRTTLYRAEQVGIKIIVFGSGGARTCPAGYDKVAAESQIEEHLATWSRWAREHGVQMVLEPLRYAEANTLNTVAESGALVSRIANSGARLLADTYHMASNQEDPQTILLYGNLLEHVHVAELEGRSAPGRHGEDLRPYFSVLRQAGYDQRISIECRWNDFAAEVEPALAVLKEQWATSHE
jgi:sugar phosphate isomerase/epimerase